MTLGEVLRHLSIRSRKTSHNSGSQSTHSQSSDPTSPVTPQTGDRNGTFTSPPATMIPEDLTMPSPSYGPVGGPPINNREKGLETHVNIQNVAAAARNNESQESPGENKTLEKIKNQVTTMKSVVSTAVVLAGGTAAVTQNMSSFAAKSAVLMDTLDAVAQLHPFIHVAVLAFKVVWTLEMKRRENNKKIEALHKEMYDMMAVLLQLQDIQDPRQIGPDGKTIEGRMQNLVTDTAKDIEACGNVCDAYARKKLIVKVLSGSVWELRLAEFGVGFNNRRTQFQFALSMHTAAGVDMANRTLGHVKDTTQAMNEKMDMMMKMIQDAMSSEEKQLRKEVDQKGGRETVLENETLLMQLGQCELRRASSTTAIRSKAGGKPYTFEDLREDLRADPEEAIRKNLIVFTRKIEVQQNHFLEETKAAVKREGDRVIDAIGAGPHDRIIDPEIHSLWKEMGWRGSIKSRYFVMALRDYYHEKWGSEGQGAKGSNDSAPKPKSDEWALAYLNIHWLQPISESFDDDASGFITVAEVNTFTTARPPNWSLPHWIAFWAIGWHQSLAHYAGKIREVFAKMFAILPHIHASNQGPVNKYLSEVYRDVTTIEAALNPCYINENLQEKFMNYVKSEETRLKNNLETVHYDIDDMDTLTLITGSGRIGKFAHALLYLLLQRHFEIFRICQHHIVHPDELWDAAGSIGCVMKAIAERFELLKSVFRQQRLDPTQQLATFAHGMFQYLNNPAGLWAPEVVKNKAFLDYPYDDNLERQDIKVKDILKFEVDKQWVDIDAYAPPSPPDDQGLFHTLVSELASVLGTWNGFMYRKILPTLPSRGMLSVTLRPSSMEEQTLRFEGFSRSNLGDFKVSGRCSRDAATNSFHFTMKREFVSHHPTQYWDGQFDVTTETIMGTWGTDSNVSAHFGIFVLKRTAPEDLRFRPSPATIEAKKARSLWVFAIRAVLSRVRCQLWSWSHFKERRDTRQEFIALYIRNGHLGRPLSGEELLRFRRVRRQLTSADSRFYHSLADGKIREIINHGVRCANCRGTIGGARIICLICQAKNTWDTLDLCEESDCVGASIERDNLLRPHLPTHDVVKVRRIVHIRQFGKLERDAMQALERVRVILSTGESDSDLEEAYDSDYPSQVTRAVPERTSMRLGSSHHCIICDDKIALPCWYYIHREVDTFICDKCEVTEMDAFKSLDDAYDLVRCQSLTPDTDVALSKRERLANLEERFLTVDQGLRQLDSKVDDRLRRVEELLNTVLGKVKE